MEEAGKGGGPGQTRPLSRGSSEVSVEPELCSPLRRKKGRTVIDLSANFNIRWMVYFYLCGGGLVLQCKQRNHLADGKHLAICGASSICHRFDPTSLF